MKPEPVATAYKCAVCGLDWKAHPQFSDLEKKKPKGSPTLEDCVTLLKAEVARLSKPKFVNEVTGPMQGLTLTKGPEKPIRPQMME